MNGIRLLPHAATNIIKIFIDGAVSMATLKGADFL
jgi:hypothetical protein